MLVLWNKGFHEFVLTILPGSLFNTLMDLSYSAFASNLLISKHSFILRSRILCNFARVLGAVMIIAGRFSCAWHLPFFCHAIILVANWSSEHTFFISPMYFPHNHNLIRKQRGNNLLLLLHSIFFRYVADVKMALHSDFRSSFLNLGPIIGIHGSLISMVNWCLFSLTKETICWKISEKYLKEELALTKKLKKAFHRYPTTQKFGYDLWGNKY